MCDYTIRHYWADKSYGATIEPSWLTSSSAGLSKEKEVLKTFFNNVLLKNYNRLAHDKPKQEVIDGYTIKYSYKDKDDPDPTNNRKVTDIIFCITVPRKKSHNFTYAIFILFLIGAYILFPSNTKNATNNLSVEETITEKEIIQEKPKVVKKELRILEKVCDLNITYDNVQKCWSYYVKDRCEKKTQEPYFTWFKSADDVDECQALNEKTYFDFDFKDKTYGKNQELEKLLKEQGER